jgi:transposase
MPYRKISRDIKLAAIRLYERELLSLDDILDCVGFHERTFYRILALWRETGDVVRHNFGAPGRPRILHFDDIDYLLRLIRQRPDWFLDELLNLLRSNRFISVHYTTVHNALIRAGVSLKKLKKIASERNEDARNEFIGHMAMYDPEELGFLDETSKNEKTAARSKGRARKGQRAVMQQHFIRGHRLSATALLTVNGISVTRVVEGSMTREMYLNFLEHEVVRFFPLFFQLSISDFDIFIRCHYAHHIQGR